MFESFFRIWLYLFHDENVSKNFYIFFSFIRLRFLFHSIKIFFNFFTSQIIQKPIQSSQAHLFRELQNNNKTLQANIHQLRHLLQQSVIDSHYLRLLKQMQHVFHLIDSQHREQPAYFSLDLYLITLDHIVKFDKDTLLAQEIFQVRHIPCCQNSRTKYTERKTSLLVGLHKNTLEDAEDIKRYQDISIIIETHLRLDLQQKVKIVYQYFSWMVLYILKDPSQRFPIICGDSIGYLVPFAAQELKGLL